MSGQPYKYYTDVEKYKNEYLDALNLRASIDDMNLQANKTYKETGTMPAVSQMKDSRTTSEILADTEKLKIDIVDTLAKVSNQQFALSVVQRIMNSPLNQDNSLLIFTAQRVNDLVDRLKRVYTYGIKGDQNDVQQIVNFISSMYNDKNALASSTKDYILKYQNNNLGQYTMNNKTNALNSVKDTLITLKSNMEIMHNTLRPSLTTIRNMNVNSGVLSNIEKIVNEYTSLTELLGYIINLIPTDDVLQYIDNILLTGLSGNEYNIALIYKDYISTSIPSQTPLNITMNKLDMHYNILLQSLKNLSNIRTPEELKAIEINISNLADSLINIREVAIPAEQYDKSSVKKLNDNLTSMFKEHIQRSQPVPEKQWSDVKKGGPTFDFPYDEKIPEGAPPTVSYEDFMGIPAVIPPQQPSWYQNMYEGVNSYVPSYQQVQSYVPSLQTIGEYINSIRRFIPTMSREELIQIIEDIRPNTRTQTIPTNYRSLSDEDLRRVIDDLGEEDAFLYQEEGLRRRRPYTTSGNGIRKRGRPKGSGIQKKYSDVVKQSISNDKGIQEDMRFVKFGKYLINNKKLNDGILAVKRPSGNNILEFPSQRISGNMQNVIKTMIGGGIPKYEQLECLSEPEKAYLHKLSSKANIIDKFSIPAPSKTQYEKDIHDFEVMKGQIMSGNDNKDLIKKFKLHIMKLSKMGALPKRDVSDLLEMLIDLGY